MRTDYENEVVRLADLTITGDTLVGYTFRNCLIIGPAVVLPMGETVITRSRFAGPRSEIFWVIEPDRPAVIGGVGFENCIVEECTLDRIGFAGPSELRNSFPGA